jgi:glucokinase
VTTDSAHAEPVAIAIDLGGTQFRVAAVAPSGQILHRAAYVTRSEEAPAVLIDDLVQRTAEVVARLPSGAIVGLGVAAPGPLDPVAGIVFQAPNLPRWHNVPLVDELQRATGLQVVLGNDANLAGLAEARCGAGRGAANLVYLTVSTGIGSGMIIDGRMLLGEHGAAAEAGHMAIAMDGPLCGCGNRGCLEAYASGTAMARRAAEAIAAGRATILAGRSHEIEAIHIAEAAAQGDALAREIIADAGRALGIGVRNLLHLFNPAVVVIGGGVSRIGPPLWDPMWDVINADCMEQYRQGLQILPAALGDDPGLIGAGLLTHELLGNRPTALGQSTPQSDLGNVRHAH